MLFASNGARIVFPTLVGCVCYFVCGGSRLRLSPRCTFRIRMAANECNFLRGGVEVSAFKNINKADVRLHMAEKGCSSLSFTPHKLTNNVFAALFLHLQLFERAQLCSRRLTFLAKVGDAVLMTHI